MELDEKVARAICAALLGDEKHWVDHTDVARAAINATKSEFTGIGVIDSEGDIYPCPPEAGTLIFVKSPNASSTHK